MKTKRKRYDAVLHNIFNDAFPDEETRELAIKQSKIAYTVIKQDALFRTMPTIYDET